MSEISRSPLKIGLLNMMSDGALRATERQFQRLLSCPGNPEGLRLEIFSLPELERSREAARHIAENYTTFHRIRKEGLDALIITGINLSDPCLENQSFWLPLIEVMDWAGRQVPSTICSCLATHAVLQFGFGQKRRPLGRKLWGVFDQDVIDSAHPLTAGLPALVPLPHSRHNDVAADQFLAAGFQILIAGGQAGVHLAATPDLKLVVLQGHPEYDTISLLKEYKREVALYERGLRDDYPPVPENYLTPSGEILLAEYRTEVETALNTGAICAAFPEDAVIPHLVNEWSPLASVVFSNWLNGLVRQV